MRGVLVVAVAAVLAGCGSTPWRAPQVWDFSEDRVTVEAEMGVDLLTYEPLPVPAWVRAQARAIAAAVCETEYKRHPGRAYEGETCIRANSSGICTGWLWTAVFPCREKE